MSPWVEYINIWRGLKIFTLSLSIMFNNGRDTIFDRFVWEVLEGHEQQSLEIVSVALWATFQRPTYNGIKVTALIIFKNVDNLYHVPHLKWIGYSPQELWFPAVRQTDGLVCSKASYDLRSYDLRRMYKKQLYFT